MLIDFELGRYFSSLGTGGEIIRLLDCGYTPAQISAAFEARYSATGIGEAITSFVADLLREKLFVADAGLEPDVAAVVALSALSTGEFVPPKLEKYVELEDLLKLDPIHDVDPAGWPLREVEARV